MSESIKVLHVVGRMDRGGTEALLMNLLRTIDRNEFCFDFVEQTNDICDHDEEILSLGSKIYRCPHISARNLRAYKMWWRSFFLEHPEYKIIHGHSRGSAPVYLKEAKRAGRITIAHCHNNSHGRGVKGLIRYIWQRPLKKLADYNFACSYDSGISQFGKKAKFEVIKNGIITKKFTWNPEIRKEVRSEFSISDKFVIGNVARLEEQKNHFFLIKIFKVISEERDDAVLMLVGQGTRESQIRQLVHEFHLDDKVIFTGVRDDVSRLMQAMDAFVLPSYFEGFGMVNIEAQTAGLPCFVSASVVPEEVNITELMHYIPLSVTEDVWARTILKYTISENERRDMSSDVIKAGYDVKSTAERLADFYRKVACDV